MPSAGGAWLRSRDSGCVPAVIHFGPPDRILAQGAGDTHLASGDVFYDIMCTVTWNVEFTEEFFVWWSELGERAQDAIGVKVHMLQGRGPLLGFPHSSGVVTSRHAHLRQLREEGLI